MHYLDLATLSARFQALSKLVAALNPPDHLHRAALALSPQEQSDLALAGLLSLERLADAAGQFELLPQVPSAADAISSGGEAVPSVEQPAPA